MSIWPNQHGPEDLQRAQIKVAIKRSMKTLTSYLAAIALLAFLHLAAAQDAVTIFSIRGDDGQAASFTISAAKVAAQPDWRPEDPAPPPLSIAKACALARQSLIARNLRQEQWALGDCTLRNITALNPGLQKAYPHRWFYQFTFHSLKPAKEQLRPADIEQFAVVLMDGSIVEPSAVQKVKAP